VDLRGPWVGYDREFDRQFVEKHEISLRCLPPSGIGPTLPEARKGKADSIRRDARKLIFIVETGTNTSLVSDPGRFERSRPS
jgi:hypothetical protein